MDKRDIHSRKIHLESSLRRLASSDLSEQNKKLILSFKDDCAVNSLTCDRLLFYLDKLSTLAHFLKKDLDKADIEDVKSMVKFVEEKKLSPYTKEGYKVALKKFYKWLNGGEEYPKIVSWIRASVKKSVKVLPVNLLTKEEVMQMVDNARYFRDKALIMTLYESGFRVGELLNMKIGDLEFTKYGVGVTVMGKTGCRRILLISSTPYLANWLASHPDKHNPDAYVWTTLRYNREIWERDELSCDSKNAESNSRYMRDN